MNPEAIRLIAALRHRYSGTELPLVLNGVIGPRGDGYRPEETMSVDAATGYHRPQIEIFAANEADMVSAVTITSVAEAVGIVYAARASDLPVVISFTLETDVRLPSGQPLGSAIRETDAATQAYPAYYMINCAHPAHFEAVLAEQGSWLSRLRGLRANASTKSHAELGAATELDIGDPPGSRAPLRRAPEAPIRTDRPRRLLRYRSPAHRRHLRGLLRGGFGVRPEPAPMTRLPV